MALSGLRNSCDMDREEFVFELIGLLGLHPRVLFPGKQDVVFHFTALVSCDVGR